jgi:hypothetical protein
MNDSHTALITKLGTAYPIKGADFIHAIDVEVSGITIATVVTSKEYTSGELGIYFAPDLQLSEAYCDANNLVARFDEQGNKIAGSGFFDEKRRVRAQRFKGAKSEGLWMPLSSLDFTLDTTYYPAADEILKEGDKLTELNGIEICKRYPKYVASVGSNNIKLERKKADVLNFPEHYDTAQLIHYVGDLDRYVGASVIITEKMHGTSHRVGNVPVRVQKHIPIWQRAINWITRKELYATSTWEYRLVHGTRRVILNDMDTGYYGSHDFRYNAVGNPELQENEVLYGEIVGWVNEDTSIMPPHNTSALKEVKKAFGETMYYDYDVPKGNALFYVYRITRMNEDGVTYDLEYDSMVARAKELGYDVPAKLDSFTYDGSVEKFMEKVNYYTHADGVYISSRYGKHISEGTVILFQKDGRSVAYKNKSYAFKVLEGILVETVPEADSDDT